jgi:transposase
MENLNNEIFFESFQEDLSLVEEVDVNEQTLNVRKERKMITKPIIESFLSLLDMGKSFQEMTTVLNLSKSTIKRLYKRYLNQEFSNLTNFKTASEKKKESTKNYSLEANIIATELALNPCIGLNNLTDRLRDVNPAGSYSKPTVCRIVKKCGYTNKTLTLVPINRNSVQNKILRAQYARTIDNLFDDRLVFLDETGFNLHLTNNRGYSMKNSKCYINVLSSKGTNVSLMCAITLNGL